MNQELSHIDGGKTIKHLKLERGICCDESTPAYLFILLLEIFLTIDKKAEIFRA